MRDLSNENVIHVKNKNIEYLQYRKLLEYKDIISHAYTLGLNVGFKVTGANNKIEDNGYDFVINSYKNICESIGCNYKNVIRANQDHTDKVKIITEKTTKEPELKLTKEIVEDGLITNKKNIVLSTTNADCILLMFFDPVKKVIANTHSGWKGTVQRISVKTIRKMKEQFGCEPKDIICCISPSIRKCHFEVDEDVKDIFLNEFKNLEGNKFMNDIVSIEKIIEKNPQKNKWNIDTVLINKILMKEEGLKPENIIDSGICSMCNSDIIHSYRVEKENYKTEAALIELK
ncbi:MAG: polyphenol oxidase family protein [Clostridia bacterium]